MSDTHIVKVKQGELKGLSEATNNGFKFNSFLGVPYAKPPVGNLRFQAPQPVESWQGIRDATEEGESCYCDDKIIMKLGGSEDCLYLNVFTPELPTFNSKPKAVMVWIHGGAYVMGSGSRLLYGPEFLIERDIVLVTINYRLGILGFLTFEDKSLAPANVGLRDQLFALQWVQENIHNFGGDPNNVTIFGESAGSGSVQLLTLSPLAEGLFHKAILQSGSAISAWSFGQKNGITVCKLLGKEAANEREALKILQGVTVEELIAAQNKIPDTFNPANHRLAAPVVEDNTKEAFLPKQPLELLTTGAFYKVPILIGYNSQEGLLVQMMENMSQTDLCPTDLEQYIPFTFGIQPGTPKAKEIAAKIKEFYFGNKEPSKETKHIYYKIFSDTMFLHGIYTTVEEILKHSREKLYLYKLSLKCELNQFAKVAHIQSDGVSHAEDLFYLFKNALLSPELQPGSVEDVAIQRMTKWWTNFAKHGDPNGVEQDEVLQPRWPSVDSGKLQCLDINTDITVQYAPEEKSIRFWKSIEKYAQSKL